MWIYVLRGKSIWLRIKKLFHFEGQTQVHSFWVRASVSNRKCNLRKLLNIVQIKYVHDETEYDLINKIFKERVGFKLIEIIHTITSDRTEKCIATMLNHDKDIHEMHDFYKLGKLAIKYLVRTRNKVHRFLPFARFK